MKPSAVTKLVLGSASPRRRELLSSAGVPFVTVPSSVDERILDSEEPETFTRRAARMKAEAVMRTQDPGIWVLAADTTVVVDDQILGKPADRPDAARMLGLLSGRSHRVLTAVVLAQSGKGAESSTMVETTVLFRDLYPELIQGYLDTGEPLDKAGAYGIQGIGAMLVRSISGSYTNVVGLPLVETIELLEEAGVWRPFVSH